VIALIVFDVDGCLTNGQIIYTNSGEEIKAFNVKDGLAIKNAKKLGFKTAIITGRNSAIVEKRAKELEITYLFQGVKDKFTCLESIINDLGISMQNVAAIGDDLNDLKMLKACGLSATPGDGSRFVAKEVDLVLKNKGGEGAAREFVEYIFERHNLQEAFVDGWL
jgi:3-deoxy-D-manno-octulosonate 8-phosphate phosphatase (KDO 8-P phosphatase)